MVRAKYPYLYRITSFDRVVQMLESNEIYFAHPSSWEDPYETRLVHRQSQFVYGLCWCKIGVSDAMWRVYSPNNIGVRIRTTRERLRAALQDRQSKQPDFRWQLQDVRYVFQDDLESRPARYCDFPWRAVSVQRRCSSTVS